MELNLNNMPAHIAFIMDGNGRWAKKRNLPRRAGHKAGSESLRKILTASSDLGIKYVSVYAFSTENWARPKDEVDYLMNLMEEYIDDNLENVNKNNYRLKVIGNRSFLKPHLIKKIEDLEKITADKQGMTFIIALSYGGRDELTRAFKKACEQYSKGAISVNEIDEKLVARFLDTKDIPDPDLVVRTSGEQRMSNFLIWQAAYSEIYFTDKLWPDFNSDDLKKAIGDYQNRERRFGKA